MPAEMQSGFSWDDVRVLLALVRARTLSGAAARLGVNPSTVGRRLEALEEALGARLFDRTPDGLAPTAASGQLLEHAERVERAAEAIRDVAQGFERRPAGVVRITAPPGVAEHFLAPALPRLLARYPDIRVELDASVRNLDLTRREADLALRAVRPASGDLLAVKIADEQDRLVTGAAYAAALGAVRRLSDVRWIGWQRDLAHLPTARWVNERVPEAQVVLRTNSVGAQLGAAEAGLGVALLPESYARLRSLVPVRLAAPLRAALPPTPRQSLWLVGQRAARNVPRIAAVWEAILDARGVRPSRASTGERRRRIITTP